MKFCYESFGLNGQVVHSPKPMARINHHHEIELNYLVRGEVTHLYQWARRKLPVRRLALFWGATPHCVIEAEPDSILAWITIPLPLALKWRVPEPFLQRLMEGEWFAEQRADDVPERYPVLEWVNELAKPTAGAHQALLLELEACLIRLAEQNANRRSPKPEPQPHETPAIWRNVEAMARFMAANFSDGIDVSDVARAADLQPNYAMALFRRATGATIKKYLLQNRITHAQRLLLTTDDKVIDIAMASGFSSLSAFYNAFVRQTKCTPNHFRRRIHRLVGD